MNLMPDNTSIYELLRLATATDHFSRKGLFANHFFEFCGELYE